MRKRAAVARSCSIHLVSPLPLASPLTSPKPYEFNIGILASSKITTATSPLLQPSRSPRKTIASVSDLKDFASTRASSIKRQLDLCHSEIHKEIDASKSRLSKRLKIHSQACVQMMDEAEKENKKLSDRISENMAVMNGSYVDFIAESQATASRVCKVSIPKLAESLEKAIEGLRNRNRISSAAL